MFSRMIWIPPENQSYRPKIGDTGQKSEIQPGGAPNPNRIAQRRHPNGFSVFLQKRALKPLQIQLKGVFAEKGARFRGKWGLGPPPLPFSWVGVGGFTENPRGGGLPGEGGGGCVRGIWGGGGRGPIYRENEPPFRRKRLLSDCVNFGVLVEERPWMNAKKPSEAARKRRKANGGY